MARFRSINGKWYPEKERFIDVKVDDPKDAVYEGPDRAAMELLKEQGVDHLGNDCRMEETTIIKARSLGLKDTDEYLKKYKNVDLDKIEVEQKKKLETKVHNANKNETVKAKPVSPPSGGQDTSGQGKSRKGGFGSPDDVDIGSKRM